MSDLHLSLSAAGLLTDEPADAYGPEYAVNELLNVAENVIGLDGYELRPLLPRLDQAISLIECAKRKAEGKNDAH